MSLWLFTDGAARGNPGRAAAGYIIADEQGRVLHKHAERLGGRATNNEAEYFALILGLQQAQTCGSGTLNWASDSRLVVEQMRAAWKVKEPRLKALHERAVKSIGRFDLVPHWRPRSDPHLAAVDKLINEALDHEGALDVTEPTNAPEAVTRLLMRLGAALGNPLNPDQAETLSREVWPDLKDIIAEAHAQMYDEISAEMLRWQEAQHGGGGEENDR